MFPSPKKNTPKYNPPNDTRDIKSFFLACQNDDLETVKKFTEQPDFDINQTDAKGNSALVHAIVFGSLGISEHLIKSGINIKQMTIDRKSLLHLAIIVDELAIVELLLKQGLDPNAPCEKGVLPLVESISATKTQEAISATKIQKGIVAALLKAGANPNAKIDTGAKPNVKIGAGDTPLILAAKCKGNHAVRDLIRYGADINHRNDAGHRAVDEFKRRVFAYQMGRSNYGNVPVSENEKQIKALFERAQARFDTIQSMIKSTSFTKKNDFNMASITLTQAAASNMFPEYLSYRLKNSRPIHVDEFLIPDTSGVCPMDVLKQKGKFSQVLRIDLWKGREDALRDLYKKSFKGYEKAKYKSEFQSFLALYRLANMPTKNKPKIRRRK